MTLHIVYCLYSTFFYYSCPHTRFIILITVAYTTNSVLVQMSPTLDNFLFRIVLCCTLMVNLIFNSTV